jgi:hypothetical protein
MTGRREKTSAYYKVKTDSLIAVQQTKSASKILRSADVYQQRFLKFKNIGIFHSYAEYIHAALLEANTNVSTFVPQPYKFMVGNRRYIPDCYDQISGENVVIEIKPRGEFKDELRLPLSEYLRFHNMEFKVISNESILEQETLGLNWIQIIQTLLSAQFEDTEIEESLIWQKVMLDHELTIGDIVDSGNRIEKRHREVALFRLAHRGNVSLRLDKRPINFETEVALCN